MQTDMMNKRDFINRYNELATLFLQSFNTEKHGENFVFSPFSILSILSVLADATGGLTRQEILDALYDQMQQGDIAEQLCETGNILSKIDYDNIIADEWRLMQKKNALDFSRHMNISNAMFVREDYGETIHQEFIERFREMYGGLIFETNNIAGAMKAWLTAIGKGYLEIPQEPFTSEEIMTLVNAVFFDAMWMAPYKNKDVKKRVFTNIDATKSTVNMMYGTETTYVENEQAIGFVKEFQQCDYSFMALLPRKKGPEALQNLIRTVNFQHLMNRPTYASVRAGIPEFTIESEENLKQACADMGITEVLTPNADFSPLTTAELPAKKMIHRAKIAVDRNGVKAAAATLVTLCLGLPPEEKKEVILNRPFVFAIMHRSMYIPVFVGIVNQMEEV